MTEPNVPRPDEWHKNILEKITARTYMLFPILLIYVVFYIILRAVFMKAFPAQVTILEFILSPGMIILVVLSIKVYSQIKGIFDLPFQHLMWFFYIIISASCLGFSGLSYALNQRGLVEYISNNTLSPGALSDYYIWHLVNEIPVLNVWNTLKIDAPLQPAGLGAGLLLILFRLSIIIPFIALVKKWLDTRKKKAENENIASTKVGPTPAESAA